MILLDDLHQWLVPFAKQRSEKHGNNCNALQSMIQPSYLQRFVKWYRVKTWSPWSTM